MRRARIEGRVEMEIGCACLYRSDPTFNYGPRGRFLFLVLDVGLLLPGPVRFYFSRVCSMNSCADSRVVFHLGRDDGG